MQERRPLEGIRVIDFSRVMAGPFCTALLADLGAEVIKVESPQGDDYRHIGPFKSGESALFQLMNRGKKSVVLDLKSDAGARAARKLIETADVVVENFRPGVARRLGIDYSVAAGLNPHIIYLSISGFGQHGPMAHRPAYDLIAQAMAGIMSVTGSPDGPPMRVGDALGDLATGLYGSWAIGAALVGRERFGIGQYLDVAMFDAIFSFLPTPLSLLLYAGQEPQRTGNDHSISSPFGSFRASDGHVIIAVANDALFARLMQAIGREAELDDLRFRSDEERTRNIDALREIIEAWTTQRTVDEVVGEFDAHGIPAAPIWTVEEAAGSEHAANRKLVAEVAHPVAGQLPVIEQPVHFSTFARGALTAAPLLGEHTDEILRGLEGAAGADDAGS